MEINVDSKKYGEHTIIIDDEDFEKVKEYKWHVSPQAKGRPLYAKTMIKKDGKIKIIKLHRLIMNFPSGYTIDHINNDSLDNRKENLRICTSRENSLNCIKRKTGTSVYKGVSFDKSRNKYASSIMVNRKTVHLGRFETEDQAAIAYNIAAVKYFGRFARPNDNIMMHKGFH